MWRVALLLAACGVAPPPRVEPAVPPRPHAVAPAPPPIAAGERVFVQRTADRIALVPGAWQRNVHAYHPDDVELWFRSREACEQAAAVRNATPITPASLTTLAQAWGGC